MKFIKDFRDGETIVEHYLCKSKQTLKSRSDKNYLSLKLQDKTGTVIAKVWDINNNIQSFEENNFIKIDAIVTVYQNEFQLNIKRIRKSLEGEYDPLDFIPSSEKDTDSMHKKVQEYISSIKNTYIKQLLENILLKDETISTQLLKHSAAKNFHHSYMGGLLEHTLGVVEICNFMASKYDTINRDLLIAGALLHDICKIYELSSFPINDYTDDGQLLGHIYMGAELISSEAKKIKDFPHELESILKHMILSHHGTYEYGSPKLPKILEAFILHCADDMDAKIKVFEDAIANDKTQGKWVGYHKALDRNIRKSYLD